MILSSVFYKILQLCILSRLLVLKLIQYLAQQILDKIEFIKKNS